MKDCFVIIATVFAKTFAQVEDVIYRVNHCQVCPEYHQRDDQNCQNHTQDLKEEIQRQLISLSAINTQEMCHYMRSRDIFDDDISSTNGFTYFDIPVNFIPPLRLRHSNPNITEAIELVTIAYLLRKLDDHMIKPGMSGQIFLRDTAQINAKLRYVTCALKRLAKHQGIQIPRRACKRSMKLPNNQLPKSRAQYAQWIFATLKYNRVAYCRVFNEMSLNTGFVCDNLRSITMVCLNN